MNLVKNFLAWMIRTGSRVICLIDPVSLERVPEHGPLILVINHINSLEVPLLAAYLHPRKLIGLAKVETWDNRFMGWLFDLWEAIPIRRGELDLDAARRCLKTLKSGEILVVAPEGTRSYSGVLQRGEPGIAMFALRTGAPIIPVAHWGGEKVGQNIRKLKRTDFHIRVGEPFTVDIGSEKENGVMRQHVSDEIMQQLARLMPAEYQGEYAGNKSSRLKFLQFI